MAVLCLCVARAVRAQPVLPTPSPVRGSETSPAAPTSGDGRSSPPMVVEQAPRIIYAPDESGTPVPTLLNVPLSTIQRLLDQQDGLPSDPQPPPFVINRLAIAGVIRNAYAELDVEVDVSVLLPVEGESTTWTALPLRFHDASLLAPPEYEGDGQLQVGFDAEAGYRAWLRHQRPGEHHIKLKLAVPLGQAAESVQLRFFPPLANQSLIELRLPGTGVTADIENARNLTIETAGEGQSLLKADDLRNQVVVTWRQGGATGGEAPTYLDVRGDIRVTIDGPGAIRSNATLDLQSYGRPIEQFSLRLPPNTKIVSGNQPGYTISPLTTSEDADDANRGTVQIKLEKPTATAHVQLVTQTTNGGQPESTVNVASFEVIGAIRQSGRVSLLTSEEWLVYWTLGPSVRRVQNLENYETTQERKQLASFQYFRQPCRLDLQIRPQGTRVGVEPTYRMRVAEDRLSLEAQLNYKIRGAAGFVLDGRLKRLAAGRRRPQRRRGKR